MAKSKRYPQLEDGKFVHYQAIPMKLIYLVDIDVDALEHLCSSHQEQYDALDTYIEDFVDAVDDCVDCNYNQSTEAFKQADYVEISKFDLPHDIEIA
jgi:hypothetical protein